MGSSIGSVSSLSGGVTVEPMAYAIDNQSSVSASFAESMTRLGGVSAANRVGAVNPVRYPNATYAVEEQHMQEDIRMSAAYNNIASGFGDYTTGYDSASRGTEYSMVGAGFDSYA